MQQSKFGGIEFNCGPRFQIVKLVGTGTYGAVVLAYDLEHKSRKVAIKKLNIIEDIVDAKRILREIQIQRAMNHPNILKIYDILYDPLNANIYIVSQFYPTDLAKAIASHQELTVDHVSFIMYQLCKGLYYLHSSNSIHRDIKPRNILANENCEVAYCDFGFARKQEDSDPFQQEENMTEYVVTRYYRAPEIMLSNSNYSKPVDVWALGCTMAELMSRRVLFNAPNYIQMIKLFFEILGKPSDEELKKFVKNANALSFIEKLPPKLVQPASKSISFPDAKAKDLLDKMLQMDPAKRITIQQCLEHPYFEVIRNQQEETTFDGELNCDYEKDDKITLVQIYQLILEEINKMKEINNQKLINVEQQIERIKLLKKIK